MSRRLAIGLTAAVCGGLLALHLFVRPSNDRDWAADQKVLASAEFRGPLITVRNIRNVRYETEDRYVPAYYDRTFDLRQLDSLWFVVEPFGSFDGLAHTFVSFGFGGREFLAISVEIRKERGERYSPLAGLLRRYEIMYVVADERDAIGLRTNYRHDRVYLYPVRTTPERMRRMFVEMLERANALRVRPEFYNTLTNTCTTNLVRHVNAIAPGRVPLRLAILLPGYSDRLAYEIGLIATDLPFDRIRERYQINAAAMRYGADPAFSRKIRGCGERCP